MNAGANPFGGRTIVPMKGKAGELPRSDRWVYEIKWDGMRIIAFISHVEGVPHIRLQSTNERDVTASFPELAPLAELANLYGSVILDGEVVAFKDGLPSFNTLQTRMHVADPAEAARRSKSTPVLFVAFDLLHLNGHDTMALPLADRRKLLEQIDDDDPCWSICDQHEGDIEGLIDVVLASQLEGIMAKSRSSVYQPARRSSDWVKYKPRLRQEFVVGGWVEGQGGRTGGLGSLLVGYYENGELQYAGRAGSGLNEATQHEWQQLLAARSSCPFAEVPALPRDKAAHWSEPEHVVEIAFGEWGNEGGNLRFPVVLGRRTDKDPTTVVREH